MSNTSKETRAQFIDESHGLPYGGKSNQSVRSALKQVKTCVSKNNGEESINQKDEFSKLVVSSPLLNSTPLTVTKSLLKLYPYLIIADKILSILTWTNDDVWESVLMVLCFIGIVIYFDNLIKFFGHLLIVGILWGYSLLDRYVEETIRDSPTLDDILQMMTRVVTKCDFMLSPISVLKGNDLRRLLLTLVFLSPIYMVITIFIIPPRKFILVLGVYVLTYHSSWSCVTRKLLWRFKLARLLTFYITGLDLGGVNKYQGGIFAMVHKKVKKLSGIQDNATDESKPIKFTYVLYENQRRWLAIGWTSNMLSYERTAWTDEFLNEAPQSDQFKLPEENNNMAWRWVDKTWRLDMTNDGAIHLSSSKPKTTATPNADDGFIYYDNTWKKPSTQDSFSKYTRRRRWIRTAELFKVGSTDHVDSTDAISNDNSSASDDKKKVKFTEFSHGRKVSIKNIADANIIHTAGDQNDSIGEKSSLISSATEHTSKSPKAKL